MWLAFRIFASKMLKISKGINVNNNNNVTHINIPKSNKIESDGIFMVLLITCVCVCEYGCDCVSSVFLSFLIRFPIPIFTDNLATIPHHKFELSVQMVSEMILKSFCYCGKKEQNRIEYSTYLFVHLHVKAIRHFVVL